MKRLLLLVLFLFSITTGFGQMKVGNSPSTIGNSSLLELEHPTKALVVTRVANTSAIINPVDGMIVFDMSSSCFKGYQNGAWSACGFAVATAPSSNGTAVVSAYGGAGCMGAGTINGTMTQGVAVSGVTMTLYANVTTIGTYSLSASQNGVTFTGAGSFTSLGCQAITLTASGVPAAAGPFTWTTNSTPSGSGTITVAAASSPSTNGTGVVSAYGAPTCTANAINGNMTVGVAVSGVTMKLYANVTTLGTYNITAGPTNGVTFTGTGTFTALGCQLITLTATGTPTAAGTNNFVTNTTPAATVAGTTAAPVVAPTNPVGLGSLSGRTCFDIALSNDNTNNCGPLSGRVDSQANFTLATTHTQIYTFTPSGTVSNVRFMYVNTNGSPIIALTGGNTGNNISTPQTATVNYSTSLNATALGLTSTNALTGDIYVVYNNGATNNGTDVQLKLTATIKDCMCCGAYVAAGVFKEFMCHNLGANTSLDPNVPVQGIHGNYYQWGRSTVVADAYTAGGPIASWNTTFAPYDSWLDASKTANDPCPSGYRVPTKVQWDGVIANNTLSRTGTWVSDATNFITAIHWGPNVSTKTLTLPAAGYLIHTDGTLYYRGSHGFYWASTASNEASNFQFTNSSVLTTGGTSFSGPYRVIGFSVRCISE